MNIHVPRAIFFLINKKVIAKIQMRERTLIDHNNNPLKMSFIIAIIINFELSLLVKNLT